MNRNCAMIGVAGFVAPRHHKAIKETGNQLVAAVDLHDAVGVLDKFWFNPRFFTEIERFDRHLEKLHRGPEADRVHYVSICSPNYLHDAHIRMALRSGADAICEKPLVINPWNLDALQDIERETGKRAYTVLQLRLHPDLVALKARLDAEPLTRPRQVSLTYITARGPWYDVSWKGREDRSGGIVTNIGIHFFDLLIWLFGKPKGAEMHLRQEKRMAGWVQLEGAEVSWFLSADAADLPFEPQPGIKTTFRSITVDGREIEFSEGFTDLHTRVYQEMLAGRGFGIDDARPSIELTSTIRQTPVANKAEGRRHPQLQKVS